MQSPWVGYGWGRSNAGYFLVFEKYREIFGNTYFEQSHNLILDLALWVGWPVALVFVTLGLIWLFRAGKNTNNTHSLLVLMAIMVFLIHAMLEFPLHYGYFLWPFCMLAGALSGNFKTSISASIKLPYAFAVALIFSLMATTIVIIVDYLKVESSFSELRFQIARIGSNHNETPPATLILQDWPEAIALARKTPKKGMSDEEIRHWEALLMYNTSPLAMRKVIGANRLNGKEVEAQAWANRACWLLSDKACKGLLDEWPISASSPQPISELQPLRR